MNTDRKFFNSKLRRFETEQNLRKLYAEYILETESCLLDSSFAKFIADCEPTIVELFDPTIVAAAELLQLMQFDDQDEAFYNKTITFGYDNRCLRFDMSSAVFTGLEEALLYLINNQ